MQMRLLLRALFAAVAIASSCALTAAKPSPPHSADSLHARPQCTAGVRSARGIAPSYDFIIVGAGAAGSIVSSGLAAAFPTASVLVLEAGPRTGNSDNPNIADPAHWLDVYHNTSLEWSFTSIPQSSLNDRPIDLGFAKGTGGSAMHNALGYVRGGQKWMDRWETLYGCDGWNSTSLIQAYDLFESVMNMVSPANDTQGLVDAIFQASQEAGFPYNPSYNNGPDMLGIANFVMSLQDMTVEVDPLDKKETEFGSSSTNIESNSAEESLPYRRVTSYQTYLESNAPSNLQLIADMLVLNIQFDGTKASSLRLFDELNQCELSVGLTSNDSPFGELILSAGTINSPTLLQRAGIGPRNLLNSLSIPVLIDLEGVGSNLRDDLVVNLVFRTDEIQIQSPPASFLSAVLFAVDNSTDTNEEGGEDVGTGTGALTNIELLFSTGNMISNSWPSDWQNSLILSPNIQQCRSNGTVHITTSDPYTKPAIDPRYLSIDSDFQRVMNAIQLSRSILSQPAFSRWNFIELMPGTNVSTPEELRTWIQSNVGTGYHYIGTCRMGPSRDPGAVVNPDNMSVWGTQKLRIVDASVAPTSFSANTQALTMAVATRGVQLIIQDIKQKRQINEDQRQTHKIETE